jgi:hypothetical protein
MSEEKWLTVSDIAETLFVDVETGSGGGCGVNTTESGVSGPQNRLSSTRERPECVLRDSIQLTTNTRWMMP